MRIFWLLLEDRWYASPGHKDRSKGKVLCMQQELKMPPSQYVPSVCWLPGTMPLTLHR